MAKSKTLRDPGAPKRNLSAYLLYQNAMRDQFKALNPGMTFGQLAKYTSAMYAEMPPTEKEAWKHRAEADKQRYLLDLAKYVPPVGYDPKGDAFVHQAEPFKAARKSGKVEKDPNAPKRNMSAYLLYQNAMRNSFKQENPGMTFGQLAKYTSCMYKNLTPEEKATWVGKAEDDKKRYDEQIAQYVPPPGHDARGNLIDDLRTKRKNKKSPKDPDAPKRASGAYVFFTNEMRPIIMKEFPGIKFVDMGRILGERWRALSTDEKTKHEELAMNDKTRFQVEMQQYTTNQAVAQQAQLQQQQQQQQQMQAMMQHQQQMQQQQQAQAQQQLHGMTNGQHGMPNGMHPAHYIDPHQYHYPEYNQQSYN